MTDPRKGGKVGPHPLDGPVMDDSFDRRRRLADWMTAKDNPFFARNLVNRVWSYLMGRGLVEPVDDMRATNPPTNPQLLDALAADFVEHHFDFRHLLRTIMNSRAYQLSSHMDSGNSADALNVYFARYTVKRLTAEQLADALDLATGTREKYQGLPRGTKAVQLPDPLVRSFLLDVFGRPPRQVACECERGRQPNIAQALHLLNSAFLNQKIGAPGGRVEMLVSKSTPPDAAIEELYLATLSRPPTARELEKSRLWTDFRIEHQRRTARFALDADELPGVPVQSLTVQHSEPAFLLRVLCALRGFPLLRGTKRRPHVLERCPAHFAQELHRLSQCAKPQRDRRVRRPGTRLLRSDSQRWQAYRHPGRKKRRQSS